MPVSIKQRLEKEGLLDEVVNYARTFGDGKTMDRYGINDWLSWQKFKAEVGIKTNGTVSIIGSSDSNTRLDELVCSLTNRFHKLLSEIDRLQGVIEEKDRTIEYYRATQGNKGDDAIANLAKVFSCDEL